MTRRRVTASLAILASAAAVGATGAQAASATTSAKTIHFTNKLDTFAPVDAAPPGLSAGDSYYIRSHMVGGDVSGRTAASCVLTTLQGPGIRQCELDFLTTKGIITTRGLTSVTAGAEVRLVVTGGTGSFDGASGAGYLTPTQTGSTVVLHLR